MERRSEDPRQVSPLQQAAVTTLRLPTCPLCPVSFVCDKKETYIADYYEAAATRNGQN